MKHIAGATITVIRHLIESILVSVDIAIREGALFCDVTCDQGPLKSNQVCGLFGEFKFKMVKSLVQSFLFKSLD